MISVVSFVNDRSELQEREEKARKYSAQCAKRRKANRLNAVGFSLLTAFDFAVMFMIIAYYIFIG